MRRFKENIKKLIGLAKKFSDKVIFIGFTPVDESLTNPVSWDPNFYCKNKNIQKYDAVVKEICKEEGLSFIELFNKFMTPNYQKFLYAEDGLHHNAEGHEKIFQIVKDFLIEKKMIEI